MGRGPSPSNSVSTRAPRRTGRAASHGPLPGRRGGRPAVLNPSPLPVPPDYAGRSLANLLTAVGAHLGVPGCDDDVVGLAAAERYVVVMVDGLGWELLMAALAELPGLADLMTDVRELATVVPSTTVTALTSLGTGLPPGGHGLVGYRFWAPHLKAYVTPLHWAVRATPAEIQPQPTLLERASAAGVTVGRVVPPDQVASPFSAAALRGSSAVGVTEQDVVTWVEQVRLAAEADRRTLVYAYDRSLDHVGHAHGVDSAAWLTAARELDHRLGLLRSRLGPDTVVLITGDHGMVDVPPDRRVGIETTEELNADLDHVAGEARFRHLHTARPGAVAARWRDWAGERAWVLEKAEAIAAGWFGAVGPLAAPRLGDVVVAARADWAFLSRTTPVEAKLVGMHGSLTGAELRVPLFVTRGTR